MKRKHKEGGLQREQSNLTKRKKVRTQIKPEKATLGLSQSVVIECFFL